MTMFDPVSVQRVRVDERSSGGRTDFFGAVEAGYDAGRAADMSTAEESNLARARKERREAIAKATNMSADAALEPYLEPEQPVPAHKSRYMQSREDRAVEKLLENLPANKRRDIYTGRALQSRAEQIGRESYLEAEERLSRAGGFSQIAGGLIGQAGAAMTDPFNIALMPFGAAAGASILRGALIDAAIGVVGEAAQQPAVQDYRRRLGLPHGFGDAFANVATAGVATGALSAGIRGAVKFTPAAIERIRGRLAEQGLTPEDLLDIAETGDPSALDEAIAALRPEMSEAGRAAADIVRYQAETQRAAPEGYAENPEAMAAHVETVDATELALQQGADPADALPPGAADPARLPPPPPRRALGPPAAPEAALPPPETRARLAEPTREAAEADPDVVPTDQAVVVHFDPAEIGVDPTRFQFKGGTNDAGVTDALGGIRRWDALKAGVVLVWRDAAGKPWIVDGHHRVDLARRLIAGGHEPIRLNAFVLDEAAGWTATDARIQAAMRNIAEGAGTPIDAAKVLREYPEGLSELPPRSALVQQGAGLARLSDQAFGMVVNEILPARIAAVVGELAQGRPELHAQLLQFLARALEKDPRITIEEARFIVRDAMSAPTAQEHVADLFGGEDVTALLVVERAKILKAAGDKLKKDRRAFATVSREASRLEEAGNRLDADANRQRVADDERLLATLHALAGRRGPIADALNDAARRLRAGERPGKLVDEFVEAIRRQGEGPDADGDGAARPPGGPTPPDGGGAPQGGLFGPGERTLDAAPEGPGLFDDPAVTAARDQAAAEGFEEPAGQAALDQLDRLEAGERALLESGDDVDVPVGAIETADGISVTTRKASDLMAEIEADADFAAAIGTCKP